MRLFCKCGSCARQTEQSWWSLKNRAPDVWLLLALRWIQGPCCSDLFGG